MAKPGSEETKPLGARLPVSLLRELDVIAETEDRPLTRVVIEILRLGLEARRART